MTTDELASLDDDSAPAQEAVALLRVAEGLKTAYPALPPEAVDAAVASAHEAFHEARIRAFIPILVERRARILLGAVDRDATRQESEPGRQDRTHCEAH
ncbi:hypothetical protein BN159_4315 [Streptomyces davaonensis JCM 4913]|uniref:Uncharacterized protein n=1 Tax=Streptomyces davaonensis (strain DSM 101723 / JCM 4913 / KCC S-0913 / 768) TaxID=1214101 RepID=K4R7L2_STRDJ|nr:hypothetical protein [Streptomyces davaonensis]CCK28694.1 hypothetical protein BN159_4315 [Streptomyces davaonensis JCM 4913]